MPKVELHVHLEGATQPATLLKLARRHGIALPGETVEDLRRWFVFRDFPHFIEIYMKISECIRTPEDMELLAREFLQGQADQHVRYTEVIFTPYTHYLQKGMPFGDQLAALNAARAWAEAELDVQMRVIVDIPRYVEAEKGRLTAEWAIGGMDDGVVALGLGGIEVGNPPEKFAEAFALAGEAGLPAIPHAGETVGPESIWSALNMLHPARILHGVRCLEDPALVAHLRETQMPLDVCPTSNICLGVYDRFENHALPRLLDAGLYVTLNSDDPPMFNTTLTDEWLKSAAVFGLDIGTIEQLSFNAIRAALLPQSEKAQLELEFLRAFGDLRQQYLI
jgi:adenosine deaminase